MKRIDQELCGIALPTEHMEEIMKILNKHEEDGWTYKLVPDLMNSALSFIEVYSEDGHFLGKL